MRTLSYEIIVNIARFLEPKDLRSFSFSGRTYMPLCKDEYLFRMLYDRDYRKYCKEYNPLLESISSWKKLYTTLHVNKTHMIITMQKYFGYKKEEPNIRKSLFHVTASSSIDDTERPNTFVDFGYQEEQIIETNKKTLRFKPDSTRVLAIRHMNLAHQVYKVDQELGRRGEMAYTTGPPDEDHLRFLKEGICLWNEKTETYHMIYPYQAYKILFEECKSQVIHEHTARMDELRDFFQQIISITYKISKKEEEKGVIKEQEEKGEIKEETVYVEESMFKNLFHECDLDVFEHLCAEGVLQVTCARKPKWTYSSDMCIYSADEYDQKQQKHTEINCKNKAVSKGYCEKHDKPHPPHLQKHHRKQREKLRNSEYANYIEKLLPKTLILKEVILSQLSYNVILE